MNKKSMTLTVFAVQLENESTVFKVVSNLTFLHCFLQCRQRLEHNQDRLFGANKKQFQLRCLFFFFGGGGRFIFACQSEQLQGERISSCFLPHTGSKVFVPDKCCYLIMNRKVACMKSHTLDTKCKGLSPSH